MKQRKQNLMCLSLSKWNQLETICLGWTLSKSSCVSCMIDVICSTGRINGNTPVSITELTDKHSQFQNTGFHY